MRARANAHFFTMSNELYFPGVVALINSLRVVGHNDPVTVLDLGLSSDQRALLERTACLVSLPDLADMHPFLLQPFPRLLEARDIVVILDSDVIATRRLDALLDEARRGKIVAFEDTLSDRHSTLWPAIFELASELREGQAYVNSGCVIVDPEQHPGFLPRWWECCERIRGTATIRDGSWGPAAFADQDALNALLMSEWNVEDLAIQPIWSSPLTPRLLARTRVADEARLSCTLAGRPVTLLHSSGSVKPWFPSSWTTLRRSAYVRCFRRVVNAPDAPVRIAPSSLPIWLRPGKGATVILAMLRLLEPAFGIGVKIRFRLRHFQRAVRRSSLRAAPPIGAPSAGIDLGKNQAAQRG